MKVALKSHFHARRRLEQRQRQHQGNYISTGAEDTRLLGL